MNHSEPHPKLAPLLEKYGLTWEEFSNTPRGRTKATDTRSVALVRGLKSDLVTDLHNFGMAWSEMCEVTGKTVGFIQKYTKAAWNEKSRTNRKESAARVGRSLKGLKKDWYSEQLKQMWTDGVFDFHKGRVRPEAERHKIRQSWSSLDKRDAARERMKLLWKTDEYGGKLLTYHRSPEERRVRSLAQALRMKENPAKWVRGKHSIVQSDKFGPEPFVVRSSYEKAKVAILDQDPNVVSCIYELVLRTPEGKTILPDFLVTRPSGDRVLIEVKAAWALSHPPAISRLYLSEQAAKKHGWGFEVWTEKEIFHGH